MSDDKTRRKSFFTPCRTVGLKRRSIGTPSPAPSTSMTSSKESKFCVTPKRIKNDEISDRIPKKLKISPDKNENKDEEICTSDVNNSVNDCQEVEEPCRPLVVQISEAESRINKMKDEVRNLESVSLNAKQHDLGELIKLTSKWRNGCQQALNDLLIEFKNRDNACTMSTLLSMLGIPSSLVHYSETESDFYE